MKPFLFLAFALCLLGACKKEQDFSADYRRFAGTWELERFYGFPGNLSYPAGNGNIVVLGANSSIERREQGIVQFQGRYTLQHRSDCHPRESSLFFSVSDDDYAWDHYIELVDGKLILSSSNCLADGGTTIYRRVEE